MPPPHPVSSRVVFAGTPLEELARAGYRWKDGQADAVRYHWLLPPDWVIAGQLPATVKGGLRPLCGAGDRERRFAAALGYVRGVSDSPEVLIKRSAPANAQIRSFPSRLGPVSERIESTSDRTLVMAVHALDVDREPYRFFITAVGRGSDPSGLQILRTITAGLSVVQGPSSYDLSAHRRGRLVG